MSDALDALDTFYDRAYSLISSEKARAAFDIKAEPAKVRDAYGRTTYGQSCLLARRLVEAGVSFVTVDMTDRFTELVTNQMAKMRANGEADVAFRIALKDGKVSVTARAVREDDAEE